MSANFHTLPSTEGKPIEKASIWEPERSMFKIIEGKLFFLSILMFIFVVLKLIIPKT